MKVGARVQYELTELAYDKRLILGVGDIQVNFFTVVLSQYFGYRFPKGDETQYPPVD